MCTYIPEKPDKQLLKPAPAFIPAKIFHGQINNLPDTLQTVDKRKKDAVFTEGGYGEADRFALNGVTFDNSSLINDPEFVYGPRLRWEAENPELIDRFVCIRTEEWKYIRRELTSDELFDLKNDPDETVNKYEELKNSDVIIQLKERLLDHYLTTTDAVAHRIDDRLCAAAWSPEKGLRK